MPHGISRKLLAERDAGRGRDQVDSGRLRDDRDGAAGARIRLEDVELAVVDDELDVDQSANAELARDRFGHLDDARLHLGLDRLRRKDRDRVAGMDAGALDVLEDSRDEDFLAVEGGVDLDFEPAQILVDQQRRAGLIGGALSTYEASCPSL